MSLRTIGWLSLTACFLQTPWWSSCWTWVHLKTDEQLPPQSHTLSEVTNFGQYLHLSPPLSSCWRNQSRWLEMLWSWEPSIGWKKTSASSVTSRMRTLSVSVWLLVWMICLANQCLVGCVCAGLSVAHGFIITRVHFNPLISMDLQIHFYHYCTHSCCCLVPTQTLQKSWVAHLWWWAAATSCATNCGSIKWGGQSSAISTPWCANVTYTTAKESTNRCVIRKTNVQQNPAHLCRVLHKCVCVCVGGVQGSFHQYVILTVWVFWVFSFLLIHPLDYEAFKEAAEQFQPYIKFFATFEKSVSNNPNKWMNGWMNK